jgi:hypothetical protein
MNDYLYYTLKTGFLTVGSRKSFSKDKIPLIN